MSKLLNVVSSRFKHRYTEFELENLKMRLVTEDDELSALEQP
jgi:hypothetical protein